MLTYADLFVFGIDKPQMANTFELQKDVPLAPFTTLKIGGKARFFVRVEGEKTLREAFDFAENRELPIFVLGGGSNVLISDEGFDGVVLHIAFKGIISSEFQAPSSELNTDSNSEPETGRSKLITVGAGEDWDDFVAYCVEKGLAGIECLSGIPGFVGGTPVQNVGAYGQEVAETIMSVRCFDRESRQFVKLENGDCGFSYRSSIFNSVARERYIVLNVTFALRRDGKPKIIYEDLLELFAGQSPSLAETRDAVLQIRRAKSMVIDPNDINSRSAGSFFKNPIVSPKKLASLASVFGDMPYFSVNESNVKIPAAWLIEKAGFHKGMRRGPAGISNKHTLALVNFENASAADILDLKTSIQAAVNSKFGIMLQPEPVFIGF